MTCFRPLIRVCNHYPELYGKKSETIKIIGSLKDGDLEFWEKKNEEWKSMPEECTEHYYEAQVITCGKCIGCRITYSKNGQTVAS